MKIVYAPGQTCNKFWIHSNYLTQCIENNEKMIVLVPDITLRDYPNLLSSETIKYPLYSKRIEKIIGLKKYLYILNLIFSNIYSVNFFSFIFKHIKKYDFINGTLIDKKSKNYFKLKLQVLKHFEPKKSIIKNVSEQFLNIKKDYDLIVGVHIRLGDYKTYKGGKYYYSFEQYNNVMNNIKKLFPNKKIAFFISSNENIDFSLFSNCFCFSISNSSASKDLYALCCCDFIIGPPSTFSGWASFYNNIPLYFIEDSNRSFELYDFKQITEIWKPYF